MTQPFIRDRFTWLTYLLLAFYGYFLNILGPITPFLKDELELSYTVSSLHFTAFASGIAILTLPFVLGRLADTIGIGLAYGVVPFLLLGVLLIILFAGRVSAAHSMVKA
jgi:MFS family permease